MINQAVILCGGRGKRLGTLTDAIPKPMIEVCGRPFVYYLVTILKKVGIEDIVLSVGYLKEKFDLPGVKYADARLEVNDSVLNVPFLQDLFVLVNGDVLPLLKWEQFLDTSLPRVAVKLHPELKDVGICIVDKLSVSKGWVNCGNIKGMIHFFDNFVASGNLHIGTQGGLARAREFIGWWWRS